MAINFPAFCPSCGLIFGSGIAVGNSRNITFEGVRSACPGCGAWAEVPDGTFNVINDTVEILSGSGLTRARLLSLAAILNQARAGEVSAAAAVEAVSSEAPSLRPLIDRYGPKMRAALIVFLWAVIQVLLAQGLAELRDDSATRHDVQKAVEQAIQHSQKQHP